jgi:hypothetical protein
MIDDLTGQRFTRLEVLARAEREPGIRNKGVRWTCRCDCGAELVVRADRLRSGNTKSCGCLKRDLDATRRSDHDGPKIGAYKHGGIDTAEYTTWHAIRARCYTPTNHLYPRFGARGVTVHPRWREDFAAFRTDVGPRPSPRHRLVLIGDAREYGPETARWAPPEDNPGHRTLTIDGETLYLTEWARRKNIDRMIIAQRLKMGWDAARAVNEPVRRHYSAKRARREQAAKQRT